MIQETVSIVMPCYNGSKTIAESIESVLAQTYPYFELLICDDTSQDNSIEIIYRYVSKDSRVKLVANEFHKGVVGARNSCLNNATGRYISFLDCDDLWLPNKLRSQLVFMNEQGCSMSHAPYTMFDNTQQRKEFIPQKVISFKDIIKTCDIGCLTVMIDTKYVKKQDVFLPNIPKEDYALWIKLMKKGVVSLSCEINHSLYRKQDKSLSSSKISEFFKQWNVLREVAQLNLLKSVVCITTYAFNGYLKHRTFSNK